MPKIAFISGHTNLSSVEFEKHYLASIQEAIINGDSFVIGCANGADSLALQYLLAQGVAPSRITIFVYERWPAAQEAHLERSKKTGAQVQTGFQSYSERDAKMTSVSDYDIAWVRPAEEAKKLLGEAYKPGKISGTQRNLERRTMKGQINNPSL